MISAQDYSVDFTSYQLGEGEIDKIEKILEEDLIQTGVQTALLIDTAGNIVAKVENGDCTFDVYSLAALASANFAAVETMARLLGDKGFSLLFHGGEKENTHFAKITDDIILITIFGKNVSLGFLRLKIAKAAKQLRLICNMRPAY